jgi:predicted nuclease of restriction endonuclease-like (RecB) superfamily
LEIHQTVSGVFGTKFLEGGIWQTVSAESPPASGDDPIHQTASGESEQTALAPLNILSNGGELSFPSLRERAASAPRLDWQDQEWLEMLFSTLSFSHILELSRIDNHLKRAFYELECIKSGWSVRELKRQIASMLFERVGLSKDKDAVMAMAKEGALVDTPATVIRDPYILEFLGIESISAYSESDLEQALIDHLQQFIHELGRDFCFVERQLRITVGGRHHFVDLLFYHRSLRALIAVELKLGPFRHEYAGQMNFYLNYIAENLSRPDESPPVGLVLCADKDVAEVHYATAGLERSVFVSRYLVELPTEAQLQSWLDEERELLARHEKKKNEPQGNEP